jgi:RNA polymerase sigma-70 factor (ECF subfamily)
MVENKLRKESFRIFYQKYSKPFWRFIFKMCGDGSLTDDIFQESFFRFFRAAPESLNEHQKKSYLYKTAVRLIIDQQKRMKVEKKYQTEFYAHEQDDREDFLSADLEKMFGLLNPRERTLLWLAHVEGYSHREISEITQAKEKSIKVQLFRIRKKFAGILRFHGFGGEELT